METPKEYPKIDAALASLGLTYIAIFVPLSKSRNKGWKDKKEEFKSPTIEWKIVLEKGRQKLETEYGQGIAHAPGYAFGWEQHGWRGKYFERVAEEGNSLSVLPKLRSGKTDWYEATDKLGGGWTPVKRLPEPSLRDVMYCLISDCDVLNYACYEDWAGELGYDEDSRKGEETYKLCMAIALKLQSMIGHAAIDNLREIYNEEGF